MQVKPHNQYSTFNTCWDVTSFLVHHAMYATHACILDFIEIFHQSSIFAMTINKYQVDFNVKG